MLRNTRLDVLYQILARMVEVAVADDSHVEAGDVEVELELPEVRVRHDDPGRENFVRDNSTGRLRDVRVRLDHLLRCCLEK